MSEDSTTPQRVALTGASGFLGGALRASLTDAGHEVITFVRGEPDGPDERRWDPAQGELDPADLEGVDVVVNLSGAGIADKRWSPERKRLVLRSRVDSTTTIARPRGSPSRPTRAVSSSST